MSSKRGPPKIKIGNAKCKFDEMGSEKPLGYLEKLNGEVFGQVFMRFKVCVRTPKN